MAPAPFVTGSLYAAPASKPPTNGESKFNPFYSPNTVQSDNSYKYSQYTPSFPALDWEPLGPTKVVDKGLSADAAKKSLLSAASKVSDLTPVIGTELSGVDLRALTNGQKDELALLVAERGVVCMFSITPSYHIVESLIDP